MSYYDSLRQFGPAYRGLSAPHLPKSSENIAASAYKAWRHVGEMEEIAASFAAAGGACGPRSPRRRTALRNFSTTHRTQTRGRARFSRAVGWRAD
ncbi:MAG: DUF1932 domain-containing protein [Betaproteobacteria bacterium]|nr:DUF1932 domain-containing protein [Betaproteobacteria bacterium]